MTGSKGTAPRHAGLRPTAKSCRRFLRTANAQNAVRCNPKRMNGKSFGCQAEVITVERSTSKPDSKSTLAKCRGVHVCRWRFTSSFDHCPLVAIADVVDR